jgi:hypothetical protein
MLFSVVLVSLLGCGGKWDPSSAADRAGEFQNGFGLPPPDDLKALTCRVVNVGDTSSRWFSFECSTATFEKLVGSNFDMIERSKLDSVGVGLTGPLNLIDPYKRNINAPEWWPDLRQIQFERLYYRMQKIDSSNGYLFIFADKLSGKVFASSAAWR